MNYLVKRNIFPNITDCLSRKLATLEEEYNTKADEIEKIVNPEQWQENIMKNTKPRSTENSRWH